MAGDLMAMAKAIYPKSQVRSEIEKMTKKYPIDWARVYGDASYADGIKMNDAPKPRIAYHILHRHGPLKDFASALLMLKSGNRVKREGWGADVYVRLVDNQIRMFGPKCGDDGVRYRAPDFELLAEDWIVV